MSATTTKEIASVLKALKANGFAPVEFVETAEAATNLVLGMIPLEAKVGLGGSSTLRQIDLIPQLKKRGTTLLDPHVVTGPFDDVYGREVLRQSDVILASSNAVTLDGKLVNIDGTGNRIAGMIFGPKSVILIIGVNKIVRDVDEAIDRIKNVIAPYHNIVRERKVPCAVTLRCTDCKSPDRVCRVTMIMEKRPRFTDIAIVLVGEDLGLGWDPAWPQDRIDRIRATHMRVYGPDS